MLRIMSNNQWRRDENHPLWEARGEDCSAAARERGFVKVYQETRPDVIGFQEVSPLMLDEMMRGLQKEGIPYAAVWGRDYDGELKIVDVNIRRLRIKIEDDTASPTYITTVWGFGYKWGA